MSDRQDQNWFVRNPGKTVVLGIVGGLIVISSIANAVDADEPSPASQASFEPSSQGEAGGLGGDQGRSVQKERDRGEGSQDEGQLPPTGDEFVMPETAGMDLQLAQDTLQSVSGNPLFYSESVDATGAGRGQWWDSGWQVCWSEPAVGEVVRQSDTPTFAVVRIGENCP